MGLEANRFVRLRLEGHLRDRPSGLERRSRSPRKSHGGCSMEQAELLRRTIEVLESQGIRYLIVGSLASMALRRAAIRRATSTS